MSHELSRDEDDLLDTALRFALDQREAFAAYCKRRDLQRLDNIEMRLRDLHDETRKAHKIVVHYE